MDVRWGSIMMLTRLHITTLLVLAVLVWGVVLLMNGTPVSRQYLAPFTIVGGVLGLAVLAFEHRLWRSRILHGWFVQRPDIRGTWSLSLQSDWTDPKTNARIPPIDCFAGITQTFSKLQIHLMTPESESWLIAHRICPSQKGEGYEVVGVYTNQPHNVLRGHRSEIHLGALFLDTHGVSQARPDTLTGEYWTDRKTKGTLNLTARVDQIYTRYEDAKASREARVAVN